MGDYAGLSGWVLNGLQGSDGRTSRGHVMMEGVTIGLGDKYDSVSRSYRVKPMDSSYVRSCKRSRTY